MVLRYNMRVQRAIFVRRAVVVTKGYERAQLEKDGGGGGYEARLFAFCLPFRIWELKVELNDSGVFSLNHKDGLFDSDSFDLIGENGKGIEPKSYLVLVALRLYHARVLISREFIS